MTANAASLAAGKPDAIRNLRRALEEGNTARSPNSGTLAALAKVLRTTSAWLISGEGPEQGADVGHTPPLIEVSGKVGATQDGAIHAMKRRQWAPALPGSTAQAQAVLVEAHLREFAEEGSLLYFDVKASEPGADLIDAVCLARPEGGPTMVTRLTRGEGSGHFDLAPLVGPKLKNKRLEWAAEMIGYLTPRQARRVLEHKAESAA